MRGAVMGSAGRVPCPAPLRKGSDPREQSKSPKPWLLLAWQELIARLKAAGRREGLGMRHRTCRFAIPSTGSARSFSSSVPFLTSTKDRDAAPSFAASLRATYKRAHTTDKWVYSSQAAPASQLDKNLKRNKNITKKKIYHRTAYASNTISGISVYCNLFHYTSGLRQTAQSPLHEHLNKDLSLLWPCLCSLGIHPGQIFQRMCFRMGTFLGNSSKASSG